MADSLTPIKCGICNSASTTYLFKKQGISYSRCNNCHFVFAEGKNVNLTNNLEDFEPAYLEYFKERADDVKNHHFIFRKLSGHQELTGKTFLDIGCGSGKFVRFLRSQGFDARGIEPSQALFNSFLKNDGSFYPGTLEEFIRSNPNLKFDFIIASDVLEHLQEPANFFEDTNTLLSLSGLLFISTPNSSSFLARLSGKRWHYYNKYHLSIFSRSNLVAIAKANGLSLISSGTVTRYHSMYYLVKYALNFLFHRDMKLPRFLSRISLPMNLGDNMYLVFQKKSSA